MFAFRMKNPRFLPLLLLVCAFQVSPAQEQIEEDSTFNVIDYFSGRIVLGLGGGFGQQVSGKQNGVRGFVSSPFVYSNIGSRASIRFSNNTYWTEFDDSTRALPGSAKNAEQTNLIQLRYRLAEGLLLEAQSNFSHSEARNLVGNDIQYGNELDTRAYRLIASYYSRGGRLHLTASQLAFQYYAFPRPPVEYEPYAYRFLSPGQFMLSVRSEFRKHRMETEIDDDLHGYFSAGRLNSRDFVLPELNFNYAWKKRLTFHLLIQPLRNKIASTQRTLEQQQSYSNNLRQLAVAPQIYYFSSENLLHHLSARWSALDSKSESSDLLTGNVTYKIKSDYSSNSWSYTYNLHFLNSITPPSLSAFLADWNQDFGNRLPRGILHFVLQASAAAYKFGNERVIEGFPNFIVNEDETRTYVGSMQGNYGLTDGAELGAQWLYFHERQERWNFEPRPERILQKSEQWQGETALRFANYRFEERYWPRFGWEQLREYDRLYGPLLLRGMLSGSVAVAYSNVSFARDEYVNYFGPGSDYERWQARAQVRWGVRDNVELRVTGQLEKLSDIAATNEAYQITLAWQPWHSIRFSAGHNKNMPNPLARISLPSDVIWSFEIASLF